MTYWSYLKKSILWFVGNMTFGLAPLLFMLLVNDMSLGKIGNEEIKTLIHSGAILFVCAAVMGSVLIDYVLSGYPREGMVSVAIVLPPVMVIGLISIKYLLINMRIIDGISFAVNSGISISVISFSSVYSIVVKTGLYLQENLHSITKFNKNDNL